MYLVTNTITGMKNVTRKDPQNKSTAIRYTYIQIHRMYTFSTFFSFIYRIYMRVYASRVLLQVSSLAEGDATLDKIVEE